MIGWIKLAGIGLVAAGLLWLGLIVKGWKEDAALVPVLNERIAQVNATIDEERRLKREADEASKGYQNELEALKTVRANTPTRVVRLCVLSGPPGEAGGAAAEPGPDGAASGTGVLSERAGSDIGGRLYGLADRADELAAQVRGLQDYINRMQAENGG